MRFSLGLCGWSRSEKRADDSVQSDAWISCRHAVSPVFPTNLLLTNDWEWKWKYFHCVTKTQRMMRVAAARRSLIRWKNVFAGSVNMNILTAQTNRLSSPRRGRTGRSEPRGSASISRVFWKPTLHWGHKVQTLSATWRFAQTCRPEVCCVTQSGPNIQDAGRVFSFLFNVTSLSTYSLLYRLQ